MLKLIETFRKLTLRAADGRWLQWRQMPVPLAAAIVAASAGTVEAQVQRSFLNLGFETPVISCNYAFVPRQFVAGWNTTHYSRAGTCGYGANSGRVIEIWRSGFNGVPSRAGNQHAELNALQASRIYQTVCLIGGDTIDWKFSHRGLSGTDTAEFRIGTTNRVVRAASDNTGTGQATNCGDQGSISGATCTSVKAASWRDYSGTFTWTGATGAQQFGFQSIASSDGNPDTGNQIDEIQLRIRPFVEFVQATTSNLESAGASGLPKLRVSGYLPSPLPVTVNAAGGTATVVDDFTTPGGAASFTVTIPAGTYTGTEFELGVSVVEDMLDEVDETIEFEIVDNPGYTLSSTRTCGGAAVASATHTIRDETIQITKTATRVDLGGNGIAEAGERINYTFVVTNTGSVTLTGVRVTDSTPGVTVSGAPINLAAGASNSTRFTARYTLTQADVDAGRFENQAEVTGTVSATSLVVKDLSDDPNDTTDMDSEGDGEPDDPTVIELDTIPEITLEKVATLNDTNGNLLADVGETIDYTFTVANVGNVTLTDITVTDSKVTVSGSPIASLAPSATDTSVTATYTITQADIDAGEFENQATVSATAPDSSTITDLSDDPNDATDNDTEGDGEPDDPTVLAFTQEGRIDLLKEAVHQDDDDDGVIDIGETILYTFTVENTGNVTLTDVTVEDGKVTVTGGPIATLAPSGKDSTTFSGTYVVTQADADAGGVENLATVKAKDVNNNDVMASSHPTGGAPGEPTILTIPSTADLQLIKSGRFYLDDDTNGNDAPDAGEVIRYVFEVRNTGNVTISNITLDDPGADLSGGPIASLAAEHIDVGTFTGTHVLTQAEVDAGEVINQAKVSGTSPKGGPVEDLSDDPQDTSDADSEGDNEPDDPTRVVLENASSIDLVKEVTLNDTNGNEFADVGETLSYAFTVTNTGNVTLTDIAIEDNTITVSGSPIAGPLAPGASDTGVTGSYTITQADIDAGGFENLATATGKDPNGNDVTAASHPAGGEPGEATEIAFDPNPALELEKVGEWVETDGNQLANVDETVTYKFKIRNTGNVTLSNIMVSDPLATVTGAALTLEPGAEDETNFTGSYTLTQADIDAGKVENRATVEGVSQAGDIARDLSDDPGDATDADDEGDGEPDDPTVIPLKQDAKVVLLETGELVDVDRNGRADEGDTIHYTFQIINNGNVTLTDLILIDPSGGDIVGGPLSLLAPGDTDDSTFEEDHVITQDDIDAGEVERESIVEAQIPGGLELEVLSDDPTDNTNEDGDNDGNPDDPTLTLFEQFPGLVLSLKDEVTDGDADGYPEPGDKVVYRIRVENTGNVTLKNVTIPELEVQPKDVVQPNVSIRPQTIVPVSGIISSLLPGTADEQTLTASYTLTAADIEDGELDADARVVAFTPKNEEIEDLSDDPDDPKDEDLEGDNEPDDRTRSLLPQNLSLALEKTGTFQGPAGRLAQPGDTILYSLKVTNDGNVPVINVKPNDSGPQFGGKAATGSMTDFSPASGAINPNESITFTATYTLTETDVANAQNVENGIRNTATVEGSGLKGRQVISPSSEAIVNLPAYLITKTAELSEVRRGGRVPYTIRVKGLGLLSPTVVNIVDQVPTGFGYLSGSATLGGAVASPNIDGRRMTFENVTLNPNEQVEITLDLLASAAAKPDTYVNRAWIEDLDGRRVSAIATAEVDVVIEAVFDCGDILGKVFDDENRNGYQDEGEVGLPGVRVATVKGLLVTSDPQGRFHVACADLPDQRIGSNFIMKLDPRSLPSGYRLTTENPRVIRLTAGKASELAFGAAVGRVVRLDLTDEAFEPGQSILRPEWYVQIVQLVALLDKEPSVLRLSYMGGRGRLAKHRLTAVRHAVLEEWRTIGGRYRLEVETRAETALATP